MRELAKKDEQLLKPTATIHVGNRLSLIERKVFNAIIWHAQRNSFTKTANTLSVDLLMSLIGLERSKNMDVIKEALERLTTNLIIWNSLKKDRTTDWGICTFLAGAELSGGRLRYVLNPLLIEKVQHPTLFAKIQLLVQTQFSSKYSLALYEFLIDDLCRSRNPDFHSLQVSLDTLRHVLQFDGIYKHLNSDVLKPCVVEINKHSDISLEYRGIKQGRAVVALLFTIKRRALQLTLTDLQGVATPDNGDDIQHLQDPLEQRLISKGVGKRKAKALVETYDEERIRENIAHGEREYQAGKVKVLSAYLIRAIEEDYRPRSMTANSETGTVSISESQAARLLLEALTTEWERFRERRVREHFAALPSAEQEAHRLVFAERLKQEQSILYRQFKKNGFASRIVESQFFSDLREVLLANPDEIDFEIYRQQHQRDAVAPLSAVS